MELLGTSMKVDNTGPILVDSFNDMLESSSGNELLNLKEPNAQHWPYKNIQYQVV